jgi:hypothetical protein
MEARPRMAYLMKADLGGSKRTAYLIGAKIQNGRFFFAFSFHLFFSILCDSFGIGNLCQLWDNEVETFVIGRAPHAYTKRQFNRRA